jgi:hypothetical protein
MKVNFEEIALILGGAITTIIAYFQGKRRNNAETDKVVGDSIVTIANEYKNILTMLKAETLEAKEHRQNCEDKIRAIELELNEMRGKCQKNCF